MTLADVLSRLLAPRPKQVEHVYHFSFVYVGRIYEHPRDSSGRQVLYLRDQGIGTCSTVFAYLLIRYVAENCLNLWEEVYICPLNEGTVKALDQEFLDNCDVWDNNQRPAVQLRKANATPSP